jgi:hypothetical protein
MKKKKQSDNLSSPRGGYRENAGRKSGWNHKDTCTIRIPKEFASQLVEIARRLDKSEEIDNDTESINREKDLVTKSKLVGSLGDGADRPLGDREFVHPSESQFDIDTNSKPLVDDTVTESSFLEINQTTHDFFPDLAFALKNAKTILTAKKSARESIARLLSKLYSFQVKADDL